MFNNAALDIAIGLTFVFVLYSLLALAINEFLATIFAYRHRMLEKGLEQMLDGRSYGYYWWDKAINLVLWLYYMIKELFSKDQNEEIKSFTAFLSKTEFNNPEIKTNGKTHFYYKRLKVNEKSTLFAANVTDHPLYRRKAERSLFFKKPAYLSADSFSDILIDILGKNRANGNPVLLRDIAVFVDTAINRNQDLKKVLNLYIEQANGDLQKFKMLLENWFDDTMERVSGWYKKQSYRRSIVIGFLIAMIFNVNTIHIVKKLSKDKEARAALVKNASEYVKTHIIDSSGKVTSLPPENPAPKPGQEPPASPANNAGAKQDSIPTKTAKLDSVNTVVRDSLFDVAKIKLRQIDSLYNNEIAQNDSLLGLGWGDFDTVARKKKYDSLLTANEDPSKPFFLTKYGKPFDKPWYIIRKTFSSPFMFFGFLITALAISLGAPFWFDLLNKFVNLRVSGSKPADGNTTVVTKTTRLSKKPDPTAKG